MSGRQIIISEEHLKELIQQLQLRASNLADSDEDENRRLQVLTQSTQALLADHSPPTSQPLDQHPKLQILASRVLNGFSDYYRTKGLEELVAEGINEDREKIECLTLSLIGAMDVIAASRDVAASYSDLASSTPEEVTLGARQLLPLVEALSKYDDLSSSTLNGESERCLQATELINAAGKALGNPAKGIEWFYQYKHVQHSGLTASELVRVGRASMVLGLIDSQLISHPDLPCR